MFNGSSSDGKEIKTKPSAGGIISFEYDPEKKHGLQFSGCTNKKDAHDARIDLLGIITSEDKEVPIIIGCRYWLRMGRCLS